jgi:hypothetical protein
MDKSRKEETKSLETLGKVEIETLVNSLSFKKIALMFGISDSSARRIIYEKIEEYGIVIRKDAEKKYFPKQVPFSNDEMDYGESKFQRKVMITKYGLLEFKGNAPILKQMNQLSQVVKNYVVVMLRNNQPLNFINQE